MGIAGAALATGIGQVTSLLIYLAAYFYNKPSVQLTRKAAAAAPKLDKRLYSIGIPAILNLALPSLLVTFLNGLLAAYAQSYVVVLGIYYKLQTFLYLPANGFVQGMRPLIGYNYGAKEHKRVGQLYRLTIALSAVILAAGTVACLTVSGPLMRLFTENPETIAAGQTALRIICIGFIVSAISTTASGALEGLGKGVESLSSPCAGTSFSLCRWPLSCARCWVRTACGTHSGSPRCCLPRSPMWYTAGLCGKNKAACPAVIAKNPCFISKARIFLWYFRCFCCILRRNPTRKELFQWTLSARAALRR